MMKAMTATEDTDRLAYISTAEGREQWEHIRELARDLTARGLGGVRFVPKEEKKGDK